MIFVFFLNVIIFYFILDVLYWPMASKSLNFSPMYQKCNFMNVLGSDNMILLIIT